MTCFDVLLNLQFDDEAYNEFIELYYVWYEDRVNEVLEEKGIAKVTYKTDHPKCDIVRALKRLYRFDYYTICNSLENIEQYCSEMGVTCRLTPKAFCYALGKKYFKEHEVPFMYFGENYTLNYSKSIDFVSWSALTTIFGYMYNATSLIQYMGSDTKIIVTIYDDFIAPELMKVKHYARGDIFEAFTDWVTGQFDNVVIEQNRVTFGGVLCNSMKP